MNFKRTLLILVTFIFSPLVQAQAVPVIIDVRTPSEYQEAHLKGAKNIDLQSDAFKSQIEKLDPTAEYLLYCRSGARSTKAVNLMTKNGFKNVKSIGSLGEAAKKLNLPCAGQNPKC